MSAVYQIKNVTMEDAGSYSCVANNGAGVAEENVLLMVKQRPAPESALKTQPSTAMGPFSDPLFGTIIR